MKKLLILGIVGLFACLVGCSSRNKNVSDNSTELAKVAIDSVMATDSSKVITSLTFVKSKMPALWADTLREEQKKLGESVGIYFIGMALSGGSMKTDEDFANFAKPIIDGSASYRAKVKEYEKSDSPEYIFGLAEIQDKNDTTSKFKRVFIFDEKNPQNIINTKSFSNKDKSELLFEFMITYVDDVDEIIKTRNLKASELEYVKNNPIYEFLTTD